MLDGVNELRQFAVIDNAQLSIFDRYPQTACHESTHKDHLLGVLADVDESARASEAWPELAHVQIACLISLGEPEKRGVKSAAIIEIELIRLVDDRLRIAGRAEIQTASGDAPDYPRLCGERHQVYD